METFNIKSGDTRPSFDYRLRRNGEPIDIRDADGVEFKAEVRSNQAPVIDDSAQIINAAAGMVRYTLDSEVTLPVDEYNAEFRIIWDDQAETVETVPPDDYLVLEVHRRIDGEIDPEKWTDPDITVATVRADSISANTGSTVDVKSDLDHGGNDVSNVGTIQRDRAKTGDNPEATLSETGSSLQFAADETIDIHGSTDVELSNSTGASVTEDVTVDYYEGVDNTGTLLDSETQSVTIADEESATVTYLTDEFSLGDTAYYIEVTTTNLEAESVDEHTLGAQLTTEQTPEGDIITTDQSGRERRRYPSDSDAVEYPAIDTESLGINLSDGTEVNRFDGVDWGNFPGHVTEFTNPAGLATSAEGGDGGYGEDGNWNYMGLHAGTGLGMVFDDASIPGNQVAGRTVDGRRFFELLKINANGLVNLENEVAGRALGIESGGGLDANGGQSGIFFRTENSNLEKTNRLFIRGAENDNEVARWTNIQAVQNIGGDFDLWNGDASVMQAKWHADSNWADGKVEFESFGSVVMRLLETGQASFTSDISVNEGSSLGVADLSTVTGSSDGVTRTDDGTNTTSGRPEVATWDSANSVWFTQEGDTI